ncbi:unnamed protein product [Urochloa humidicola]
MKKVFDKTLKNSPSELRRPAAVAAVARHSSSARLHSRGRGRLTPVPGPSLHRTSGARRRPSPHRSAASARRCRPADLACRSSWGFAVAACWRSWGLIVACHRSSVAPPRRGYGATGGRYSSSP